MKNINKTHVLLVLFLGSILFSCSEDFIVDNPNTSSEGTELKSLKATINDFRSETMGEESTATTTRSTIVTDYSGDLQIVWAENDTIGVFPSTGMQVAFPMASSAGFKSATFDGGGWGLKSNATYSAYFPLIGQFYLDKTKIPMNLSNQVQNGNGSYAHLGKYDYMVAINSLVNEKGGVEFNFNHLVSILHMQIKMPKGGKYSYVVIETSAKFTTEATVNLSDGTVSPTKQSPIQIMKLENVELDNSEENPILELYILIHPVDLTGQMLYTKIFDEDNNCYTTTMQAKNFEAGTIYNSRKIAKEDLTHTGLPVTIINTPNNQNITSKENYVKDALMTILQTDITDEFCELMDMKGRGNSTWNAPKKPYAIKFNKKKSLFSLPEDKSWVLLANYYDKTLLRNDLAFYMGHEMTSLDWTPHYQQVDLMLNGEYKGIYQLGEKVKIAKKRVNVGDDGFLLEIDVRASSEDDARYFNINHIPQPVNIKDPEVEYGDDSYNFAKDFVETADAALFSKDFKDVENGWQKYMDIESFVDWYIINEISRNLDSKFYSSCYMNLKRGGKLKMGPLWDFDVAFGGYPWGSYAAIANAVEGFYIKGVTWYERLFQDPVFVAKVKERYNEIYANRQKIFDYIDAKARILSTKIVEDNRLWGTITDKTSGSSFVQAAYLNNVEALKLWISERLDWLNTNINAL